MHCSFFNDSTHFFRLEPLHRRTLRFLFGDCLSFYFHWLVKSSFLVSKGLLSIYNKQNNTRLLADMEFLFACFTQHLTRELSSWTLEKKFHIYARHVLFSISPIVSRSVCTTVTRVTTRWLEKFVDKVGSTVFDRNLYCVFATSGTITKADCPVNFTILKCGMSTIQPAWPDHSGMHPHALLAFLFQHLPLNDTIPQGHSL